MQSVVPLICHTTFNTRPSMETSQSVVDVSECFGHHTQGEMCDDYTCENCGGLNTRKKIEIERLPPVLIIHLKRFEDVYAKLETKVDFGFELDLGPYTVGGGGNAGWNLLEVI